MSSVRLLRALPRNSILSIALAFSAAWLSNAWQRQQQQFDSDGSGFIFTSFHLISQL